MGDYRLCEVLQDIALVLAAGGDHCQHTLGKAQPLATGRAEGGSAPEHRTTYRPSPAADTARVAVWRGGGAGARFPCTCAAAWTAPAAPRLRSLAALDGGRDGWARPRLRPQPLAVRKPSKAPERCSLHPPQDTGKNPVQQSALRLDERHVVAQDLPFSPMLDHHPQSADGPW